MAEHSELVSEMPAVERMATVDRLKHAKKRRVHQLKKWTQYEKQLGKESSKKRKHNAHPNSSKKPKRRKENVKFVNSVTLLEAATRNDIDEVRKLLQKGVSPDVTNEDGLTALHQCCIDDNEELLKLLLEFGANVNACDSELWTPIHAAATCGHVHLCKYLIERGAELLAVNADGNMPYDICEDEVTLDYIETEMAKRGITQEQIDETRLVSERLMLSDMKQLASAGKSLEFRDHIGATPLHIAAANGYMEVGEFLLDHHVSVDVRDNDSWQPIHAAAYWGHPDVLEMLVENGADIDAKTKSGETPFDLCDDPDLKQKILDMKDEMETHRASRHRGSMRGRHRISTRSASLRRSSLRGEKSALFMKEAKEEALHFGLRLMQDDDDELADNEEEKENLPATNIDDVNIIIATDETKEKVSPEKPKTNKPANNVKPNVKSDTGDSSSANIAKPSTKSLPSHERVDAPKPKPDKTQEIQQSSAQQAPPPAQLAREEVVSSAPSRDDHGRKTSTSSGGPQPSVEQSKGVPRSSSSQGPKYPSGVPGGTLSDLKRQRAEMRRENLDAQVQSMFLESIQPDRMKPRSSSTSQPASSSSSKDRTQNGHNNNTNKNRQAYAHNTSDGALRRYAAPHHSPVIVGDEEKQKCCIVM